jgi:DNA-directed RNA polymerase alpha subunit
MDKKEKEIVFEIELLETIFTEDGKVADIEKNLDNLVELDNLTIRPTIQFQILLRNSLINYYRYNLLISQSVDRLGLSARSSHCLREEKIVCFGDLVTKTEREMLLIQNFGRKSLAEIKDKLKEFNLGFATEFKKPLHQTFIELRLSPKLKESS